MKNLEIRYFDKSIFSSLAWVKSTRSEMRKRRHAPFVNGTNQYKIKLIY